MTVSTISNCAAIMVFGPGSWEYKVCRWSDSNLGWEMLPQEEPGEAVYAAAIVDNRNLIICGSGKNVFLCIENCGNCILHQLH